MSEKIVTSQLKEVNSIEQVNSWLSSLETNASASVHEAIKAQMQVIKYIKSPDLVDTTLDTIVLHLKKSLRYSQSDLEKEKIRESFSLMIQSYVFFMDARLQYEINNNKKGARDLACQAGEIFVKSATEIAKMAETGGASTITTFNVVAKLTNNFFQDTQDNFFQKTWKWLHKRSIIEAEVQEFYATLYTIFKKLYKYHRLIGKSIIINGLIERYSPEVLNYICKENLAQIEFYESKEFDWSLLGWISLGSVIGTFVSLIVALFRWPIKAIAGTNIEPWFSTQMYWTLGIFGAIIVLYVIIELIYLCYCKLRSMYLHKKCNNVEAELERIAGLFEEEL